MAYYLKTDEGFSECAFLFHNKKAYVGQIIRDTFFSFIGPIGVEKEIKLIKMNRKSSIRNIINNYNSGIFEEEHVFSFKQGTTGKVKINDKYSIEFESDERKDGYVYTFCPTLFLNY